MQGDELSNRQLLKSRFLQRNYLMRGVLMHKNDDLAYLLHALVATLFWGIRSFTDTEREDL